MDKLSLLIEDLENCNRCLLSLKSEGLPEYNNLITFWSKRRAQLKQEIRLQN